MMFFENALSHSSEIDFFLYYIEVGGNICCSMNSLTSAEISFSHGS